MRPVDVVTLITLWGGRLAWLAVAVLGGRAVGAAAAGRGTPVEVVATVGAWSGWGAGALALAVASVATLTAARAIVPGALAVTIATAIFGAGGGDVLAIGLPALVATVLVNAAETGRSYLEASAYGDERRFGLRPPLGYLVACVVTWTVWVTSMIAAPLAWAAQAWVIAVVATLVAVLGTVTLPRRWHQLSRRWLVFVPAGIVVHDPVVMAETLMLPRRHIVGITVADPGSRAVDLTGPTPGIAVAIELATETTAVLARRPSEPRGRPIHFSALLVSPTRPGAVLAEAARRRL